jgi:hypothetical protein
MRRVQTLRVVGLLALVTVAPGCRSPLSACSLIPAGNEGSDLSRATDGLEQIQDAPTLASACAPEPTHDNPDPQLTSGIEYLRATTALFRKWQAIRSDQTVSKDLRQVMTDVESAYLQDKQRLMWPASNDSKKLVAWMKKLDRVRGPIFDLYPRLNSIVEKAQSLCDLSRGGKPWTELNPKKDAIIQELKDLETVLAGASFAAARNSCVPFLRLAPFLPSDVLKLIAESDQGVTGSNIPTTDRHQGRVDAPLAPGAGSVPPLAGSANIPPPASGH